MFCKKTVAEPYRTGYWLIMRLKHGGCDSLGRTQVSLSVNLTTLVLLMICLTAAVPMSLSFSSETQSSLKPADSD